MEGFEEVLPMNGMFAPLAVRQELKQMFMRWLPSPCYSRAAPGPGEKMNGVELLSLCEHFRFEYPGEAKDLAKSWDESEERKADSGPVFDELVSQGWVFFDGGRWIMQGAPMGTLSLISYPSPSTKIFLENLSKPRLIAKTEQQPVEVLALAEKIRAEFCLEQHIPVESPEWFLGRLWERLCPTGAVQPENVMALLPESVSEEIRGDTLSSLKETNDDAVDFAFLEWTAWCHAIEGYGTWDSQWSPSQQRFCHEAAHRALSRQTLWGKWECDLARYVDVLQKTYVIPAEKLRFAGRVPKMPPITSVARADWLASREGESVMMERLMAQRHGPTTVNFAFSLLCSELEKTDIGTGILAATEAILSFAVNHPVAMLQLHFRVNADPGLLVDMLLYPPTACLAARWTVEWQSRTGSNNVLNRGREAQTKTFAVQDSLSVIAYHLNANSISLEECASLITWCYTGNTGMGRVIADPRRHVGRLLLGIFARHDEHVQSELLRYLADQVAYEDNIPRACFSGVLDGMNSLPLATEDAMAPVIALYSEFARKQHLDWTDATELSADMAGHLVASACAQAESDRNAFLIPFDAMALILAAPSDEALSVRASVARTMRTHVRLLARAVSGWPYEKIPSVLSDVLKTLISRGVIEHDQKGRIGALTDRYSPTTYLGRETGSPAQDLASAWRKLDKNNQDELLQAFALSDDPVLLAELCQFLPATAKLGIRARLQQLKPDEASVFWSWPELHHRIETLLIAGEYQLAREHLEDVRENLSSAPQQYWLALFALELQLFLKEEKWDALDSATVPTTLDPATTRQANDQLDFYKATSQLLRPDGDLVSSRAELQRLSSQPGASTTYRDNYFAVAIQQIIGPTLHSLSGADKVAGERLLGEINSVITSNKELASNTLLANRAHLLFALQRPAAALEGVVKRRSEVRSSELEMVVVLAKYEMGYQEEAIAILDSAIKEFENDRRLVVLKEDLQAGNIASRGASASVAVDSVSSIRSALQQLAQLPMSLVGDILGPPGLGFRGYLIREVSRAVASLQRMAGMLRDRKNPADEARIENDLNSAVREILSASLALAKWDVADQSLGGTTANGTPGERDAVIRVSGQEISVYEALVCKGLDRTNIRKHFDKLLAYGTCDIYFHVIYSYAQDVKPIFEYVRKMLEHEISPMLTYCNCKELMPPDHETSGYVATYSVGHREVAVVFLIADLKIRTV
ncbi:hypothetical protein [Escherichia marmotae]|uniref:hypothetical protein n=1 Tax=Escherichia marmotae TaxID=1499973 RepID=UPI00164FCF66|nr:hypothetical protein [Escherichia marmotae]